MTLPPVKERGLLRARNPESTYTMNFLASSRFKSESASSQAPTMLLENLLVVLLAVPIAIVTSCHWQVRLGLRDTRHHDGSQAGPNRVLAAIQVLQVDASLTRSTSATMTTSSSSSAIGTSSTCTRRRAALLAHCQSRCGMPVLHHPSRYWHSST